MPENVVFKYSEFFSDDGGLKKVKQDFEKLSDDLIAKAKEVREKTKIIDLTNTEAVNKLIKETQELTEAKKKQVDTLKTIEKLEKNEQDQKKKVANAINAETEALKKRNREARQVATLQNTVNGSIENLRARLSLVTTAWTKLTAEELENTKRGRRLVESKKNLTDQLKKLEKATGDNRREVGNYGKALEGVNGRLSSLRAGLVNVAQAAGVTLGVFGAFRVIRNSVSIIRDFEKQNATLAGVLGKTKDEIRELTEDAKRLGSVTVKTATEVAQLQEAYARLGFSQKEILDLTEPTISGSIALNSSLDDTSLLVGAVVNSFDELSTTDAPEIIDQLSKSTTLSALNFEKLSVSLPIVASAANALDVPLTEVLATLGKLADAGVETSTAATALRNIFIESASRGINYRDAIEDIRNSTNKLSRANEIFGQRTAISALVIANNTEAVKELDKELQNAQGTAKELAEKQLDTLDGAIKLLISAWEGFVLQLNDATNGGNLLASSIRFVAENLQTLLKILAVSTTTWISYNIATRANNLIMKVNAASTTAAAAAQGVLTGAVKGSTFAMRAFNLAVKSNPLGLFATIIAAVITSLVLFKDELSGSVALQKEVQKAGDEAGKAEVARIKGISEERRKFIEELEFQNKVRKANGEDARKIDEEELEIKKRILEGEIERFQSTIDLEQKTTDELKAQLKEREKDLKDFEQRPLQTSVQLGGEGARRAGTKRRKQAIQETKVQLAESQAIVKENNAVIASLGKELNKIEKEVTLQSIENLKDRTKELSILRKKLQDLEDQAIEDEEQREIAVIKRKFDREIEAIKGQTEVEILLKKELSNRLISEIEKIEKDFEQRRAQIREEAAQIRRDLTLNEIQLDIENERIKTQELIKEIIKNDQITQSEKEKLIVAANERFLKLEREIILDGELKKLEDQKSIEEARLVEFRKSFENEKDFQEFKNAQLLRIQLRFAEKQLKLLQESGVEGFDVQIEQLKAQISDLNAQIEGLSPDVDPWKKFVNDLVDSFTQGSSIISSRLQKAVQESQKSLNDQQKAVETQRRRAEQGLENTLAFEQRQEAKKEKELIQRQKRLDQINKLTAYWNTYNANLSSLKGNEDSGDAITKTLRSIAVIEALTASLASFGDGGVVEDKLPTDGIFRGQSHQGNRGGIPIMVEGKEGIFSAKEMANLGKDNFYKLKNMASLGPMDQNFFSQQRRDFASQTPTIAAYSDPKIIKELREVKKAITSQPHQSVNMPEVVNGVLQFTETISNSNMIKRNHYKIQKPLL